MLLARLQYWICQHIRSILLTGAYVDLRQQYITVGFCPFQLLKALFGTNLASHWESSPGGGGSRKPGKATRLTSSMKPGLYHACFTTPYTQFTQYLATATLRTATQFEQEDSTTLIGWLKKKAVRRIPAILKPGSKTDKVEAGLCRILNLWLGGLSCSIVWNGAAVVILLGFFVYLFLVSDIRSFLHPTV